MEQRPDKIMTLTAAINANPSTTERVSVEQVTDFTAEEKDATLDLMISDTKFNDEGQVTAEAVLSLTINKQAA